MQNNIYKVIESIESKKKDDNQLKRFIKLFVKAIESKEDREKEIIINWLYNLEFEL